jgi:hypothetical protein
VEVAAHVDVADRAEQSGVDHPLLDVDQMRGALPLSADLDHAAVFPGSGQNGFAFDHIHADRLLQVDVRTSLDRRDRVQRVPVIGRTDDHDIQVLLLQHLAVIGIAARRFAGFLPLAGDFQRSGQHPLVGVADRDDLDRRNLNQTPQVALAVPAGPDQADSTGTTMDQVQSVSPQGGKGQTGRRGLQEMPSIHAESLGDTRRIGGLSRTVAHGS